MPAEVLLDGFIAMPMVIASPLDRGGYVVHRFSITLQLCNSLKNSLRKNRESAFVERKYYCMAPGNLRQESNFCVQAIQR